MEITLFAVIVAVAACIVAFNLYKENQQLNRRLGNRARAWPLYRTIQQPPPAPPKTPEQERAELYDRQLEAVIGQRVTFYRRRVMNGGEYGLFRAALDVTRQPMPSGQFPFYVFPQVSLGQIIGTKGAGEPEADAAHRAINSKRCDLLITDRSGNPIAVLEYQGSGHNIGGTATRRDEIKRIALERAGVRFIEIRDGTTPAEMQRTIRDLLARGQAPKPPPAHVSPPAVAAVEAMQERGRHSPRHVSPVAAKRPAIFFGLDVSPPERRHATGAASFRRVRDRLGRILQRISSREIFAFAGRGGAGQQIGEQKPLMRAGVFIEQPDHDAGELGAGIAGCVFERQGPGDDLAAGIFGAGGFVGFGLDAADSGVGTFAAGDERGEAFGVGLAGQQLHSRKSAASNLVTGLANRHI